MKGILLSVVLAATAAISLNAAADNDIHYPDRAWKLNQTGEVIVVYDIDSDGKPENVRVEHSEPDYLFDDSVISQIYKWKFPKGKPQKDIRLKILFSKN